MQKAHTRASALFDLQKAFAVENIPVVISYYEGEERLLGWVRLLRIIRHDVMRATLRNKPLDMSNTIDTECPRLSIGSVLLQFRFLLHLVGKHIFFQEQYI